MFVRGVVLCLVSSTCFGLSAIFAKEAYAAGASVPTTLVGRFGVAAVVLWAIVYVRRTALPSPRLVLVCVALGLAYALQAALYFGALAEIDASLAVLLVYTYPALTMVLAVALRRESPDKRRTAALLVSGAGLVLLLDAGAVVGTAGTLGVLLALAAALCYAVYLTAAEAQPAGLDLFVLTAIVCTTSTVALAVWGAVTGSLAVPGAAAATWIVVLATVSTVVVAAEQKRFRSSPVRPKASASLRTVAGRGLAMRPASSLPMLRTPMPVRSASSSCDRPSRRRSPRTISPNTQPSPPTPKYRPSTGESPGHRCHSPPP
ncbi:hypothetical protein GCM10009557_89440 [Virgisporangium ochraceum]